MLTMVEAHAPEWVYVAEKDQWYITTAGWPWVSTLTSGEVAVAPLEWIFAEDASTDLSNEDYRCSEHI